MLSQLAIADLQPPGQMSCLNAQQVQSTLMKAMLHTWQDQFYPAIIYPCPAATKYGELGHPLASVDAGSTPHQQRKVLSSRLPRLHTSSWCCTGTLAKLKV